MDDPLSCLWNLVRGFTKWNCTAAAYFSIKELLIDHGIFANVAHFCVTVKEM